jgi:hypothetical protein
MKNIYKLLYSIILGICDTILPKVDNSINKVDSEFQNEPSQLQINYVRFFSALITFILLVLNLFKLVTFEQIVEILKLIQK